MVGAAVWGAAALGVTGSRRDTADHVSAPGAAASSQPARASTFSATRQAYDAVEAAYRGAQGQIQLLAPGGGTLAWGESRVQQSYLTMYEATRELVYLDKLIEAGEAVVAGQDDQTGQVDYQGRSLPAWGAAAPYTASCVDLPGTDGVPVLRLASTGLGLDAVVDVRPRELELFDLVVSDSTGHHESVAGLSLDRRNPNYVVSMLAGRYPGAAELTASDLREGPARPGALASLTGVAFVPQRYVFAVHTGMICAPFAQLSALLVREPDLASRYARPARALLEAAEAAVRVHDTDWRQISPKAGLYAFGVGAPVWSDGTVLPHNQYLVMARCQIQLFLATGNPTYRRRAKLMLNLFQSDLGTQAVPSWAYYWRGSSVYRGFELGETKSMYSPRMPPYRAAEDPSHGALDVDALVTAYDAGFGLPDTLMTRLVATFFTYVVRQGLDGRWTTPARFGSTIDLTVTDFAAARWIELARWDRRVYSTVNSLMEQAQPSTANYQALPVIAQLIRLA